MAALLSPRNLVRRGSGLSKGGIAGLSVGMVILALLILILAFPFIRRAVRKRHADRLGGEPEMGMAPGGSGRASAVVSPASTRRLSVEHFAATAGSLRDSGPRPVKEYYMDGNSGSEAAAPPAQDHTAPAAAGRPSPILDGSAAALAASSVDGSAAVRTESPKTMEAPSAIAPGTQAPSPPPDALGRSGSRKHRKSSKGSIGQAIEEFAEKAHAVFRRTSTRSERNGFATPVRSPTFDMGDSLAPAMSAPPPQELSLFPPEDHTTGASAEYYSGLPMSPPDMDDFSQVPTYSPTERGMLTSLVTMSTMGSLAGVPFEPKRSDSGTTDFSPLSPVSPQVKVEHSFGDDDEEAAAVPPFGTRESPPGRDEGEIKSEFIPSSPLRPAHVPSPSLPAPGTVNPMDIWRPMHETEKSHRVEAELIAIKNSPPPAPLPDPATRDSTPANFPEEPFDPYRTPYSNPTYTPSPGPGLPSGLPIVEEPAAQEPPAAPQAPRPVTPLHQQHAYYPSNGDTAMLDIPGFHTPGASSLSSDGASFTNTTPLTVPGNEFPTTPSASPGYPSTPGGSSVGASPRTFSCEQCGRVFDQIHKLNHHKRYHKRPHECTIDNCNKRFGTKTHLNRHINDRHLQSKQYHCTEPGCPWSRAGGKGFPRKDNMRRHFIKKHPKGVWNEENIDEAIVGT